MVDGAGGCGGRCVHGADGRTGADDTVGRTSGRADGAERPRTVERTGAERLRTVERTGAERVWTVERTGGRGPAHADGRTGGQADKRSGGWADWADWADGRTGGRANERVGLGLKGHIPRGPLHSWAPSSLASSERERAWCLGVQWGPPLFQVKHPYLAPGLTWLV